MLCVLAAAGKTLESLSLLAYLKQYRNYDGPHLIIVPKSTSSNWLREVNRWTNNLSVFRFHGNAEERDALKPQVKLNSITVTTYEMVILEKSFFSKIKWKYIYIDEAHRIKVRRQSTARTRREREGEARIDSASQPPLTRCSLPAVRFDLRRTRTRCCLAWFARSAPSIDC